MVNQWEKDQLNGLYAGTGVYHGELHDHANTGGTSDGYYPLSHWVERMKQLKMDFAAILDHRQVRHMYQPEWKDGLFIAGTEPGTEISDSKAKIKSMHYNILLPDRDELEKLLLEFPEYRFTGGVEGHFVYPSFTTERFGQLIDAIKAHGGFFVHPHPKQVMWSDDPCDYWFRDETGIEVFYVSPDSKHTQENYPLWVDLLAAGKRVWACAGGDEHKEAHDKALTTIYAQEQSSRGFLQHLRVGDFTCGAVGVRMCIGQTKTGGKCAFGDQRLIFCIGDFHNSVKDLSHRYRVELLDEQGTVMSASIPCDETSWFSLQAQDCAFYRVEVFDETKNLRIAVGNPIWNER